MRLANLPVQPFCLALHVFYDDGVQFAEGGGVLQNLPRGVGVVMHLDDILVANDQQAIAFGAVQNAVVDGVLVEAWPSIKNWVSNLFSMQNTSSLQPEIFKQIVEMGVVIGVVIVDILLIFCVEIRFLALVPAGVLT